MFRFQDEINLKEDGEFKIIEIPSKTRVFSLTRIIVQPVYLCKNAETESKYLFVFIVFVFCTSKSAVNVKTLLQ